MRGLLGVVQLPVTMMQSLEENSFESPLAPSDPVDAATMFVAYLEAIGVEYVFGVPGGAVEPIYNALAVSMRRGGPRPVVARHESGAAFMADGYARETGKLGVCLATSGPGATNMLTGVACAFDNAVPLLAVTGQPALPLFGKRALQESACTGINTVEMFRLCTRYSTLVSHVDQFEQKLFTAVAKAHQLPMGPAHLTIPVDLLRTPVLPKLSPALLQQHIQRTSVVDGPGVELIHRRLRQSKKPIVLLGSGCADSVDTLLAFVEHLGAQFMTTPDAKGLVPVGHPLYCGTFGFAGHASTLRVLRDAADLVIVVGTALSEWTSGAWNVNLLNERMIHVDCCAENFIGSPQAGLHVLGNLRTVFGSLLDLIQVERAAWRSSTSFAASVRKPRAVQLAEPLKAQDASVPLKPQRLMAELSRRFPSSTRFVADAGNSTAWAIHYLALEGSHSDLQPGSPRPMANAAGSRRANWLNVLMDFAPMGWAIGAAVGMARGNPEAPVVCLTGDGSYLMNGQEITVAAQEGLPVVFIILNDEALGMVKHGQRLANAQRVAFELPRINYAELAQAMGIAGHVIESPQDLEALDMVELLSRKGPTLLDVRIDGEEVPPMSLRMQTLDSISD